MRTWEITTMEDYMTFLRRLFRSNKPQIFGGWQY